MLHLNLAEAATIHKPIATALAHQVVTQIAMTIGSLLVFAGHE
jgi:hypothetical protein